MTQTGPARSFSLAFIRLEQGNWFFFLVLGLGLEPPGATRPGAGAGRRVLHRPNEGLEASARDK